VEKFIMLFSSVCFLILLRAPSNEKIAYFMRSLIVTLYFSSYIRLNSPAAICQMTLTFFQKIMQPQKDA
jgi:hypothetical protein